MRPLLACTLVLLLASPALAGVIVVDASSPTPVVQAAVDAAVDGDTRYIVSELIDGRPLRDELGRGPMPLKRLLDLATQIADGLAAAHDAGITHRDLKPENIMVTRTGRVKIVDFGLARGGGFETVTTTIQAGQFETQTEAGLISGTVPYMSPEQARGLSTDFHSDQFSFGLILYEMATGRRAFRRETSAETLDAIINDELPPMSALDARAPVVLRWITERCLAKEPADRYGATADLHRDLRTLRDRLGEAVPGETAASSRLRWWWLAVITAGAAGLVAAGTMLTSLFGTPGPPDLSALRFRPLAIESAYEGFPAWSPNGDTVAYAAEVTGVAPPPEIPFETAQLSPMARSFYGENKRVSNTAIKALGYAFRYPDYRAAFDGMWADGSWRGEGDGDKRSPMRRT